MLASTQELAMHSFLDAAFRVLQAGWVTKTTLSYTSLLLEYNWSIKCFGDSLWLCAPWAVLAGYSFVTFPSRTVTGLVMQRWREACSVFGSLTSGRRASLAAPVRTAVVHR